MKSFLALVLAMAAAASVFGTTIDISTGVAAWQVFTQGSGFVPATVLTVAQQNGTWAPAPSGSEWVSFGSTQGTSPEMAARIP
jgi:hypothetical protein